jgi:hypothetical protein
LSEEGFLLCSTNEVRISSRRVELEASFSLFAKSLKTASIWLGIRSLPPAKDESEEGAKESQWRYTASWNASQSDSLSEEGFLLCSTNEVRISSRRVESLKTASIWLGIRSLPPAKDESEEGAKESQWRSNSASFSLFDLH